MNKYCPSKLATKWTQKDETKNRLQNSLNYDNYSVLLVS